MSIRADRLALNPIQWINVKANPSDLESEDLWLFSDPDFRRDYPAVLAAVKESGFSAVMMEVLATQTLQDYQRMVSDAGLALAPGYASVLLPEDHQAVLVPGSAEEVHWFDAVRRKAEESNYFGLDTVFLAPEVSWADGTTRTLERVAVGANFDSARLDRVIDIIGRAAEVLRGEGIRAGLHNHVGTWIETEDEIERTLAAIPADLLGASFDVGHLEWAGIDSAAMITKHAGRLIDLHLKDLDMSIADSSRQEPTTYREATDRGMFREPGLGQIDLDRVIAALPTDWPGWLIVEVDRASMDPAESAATSWAWIAKRLAP